MANQVESFLSLAALRRLLYSSPTWPKNKNEVWTLSLVSVGGNVFTA